MPKYLQYCDLVLLGEKRSLICRDADDGILLVALWATQWKL